ncbi:spindle and centriole-associated protein 1 isoform X1 [Astyanax mexicanus]|uniref:spindle and centriole-associated protein 1 isoform X1 n=1 Tax=Astyanax mexicanus TaxID=7994 RepID=UPI0020CB5B9B|nr:spindle and centriole-associated protein 1 isoform X1 [Astyanax mexicanus]
MSFVRINRRPVRTKKVSATKKEWVSTVNDLSVHKSTPEELSRRHEMHRSHNKTLAQWELKEKSLKRIQKKCQPASPPGLDQARLRIIREVLSDQCQLQDVLARSDRAMAVVKDLFGDAPRRQAGFPSVTMAPDCDSDSELPVLQKPDPPTQLSLLSQSMMDQQALNEIEDCAGEHEQDDPEDSVSYSSEVCRPKRKTCKAKFPQWSTDPRLQQQNVPQTPWNAVRSGDHAALNATVAVECLKSREPERDTSESTTLVTQVLNPEPASSHSGSKVRSSRATRGLTPRMDSSGISSQSANQSSLELLQDRLGQVETELACLEPQGPLSSMKPPNQHRGLTGFSVALVDILGRIACHIRRREEQAQQETQERRRLEEEVKIQREKIDALTTECFSLREQSTALQVSLEARINELEQRVNMVILGLEELAVESGEGEKELESEKVPSDEKIINDEEENQYTQAVGTVQAKCDSVFTPAVPAKTDLQDKRPDLPAVLLSPPRQRDSRAPSAAACGRSLHFEGSQESSSVASMEDSEPRCSPFSFISLPDNVMPRPPLLLDQAARDAIQQQIVALCSHNALIQARLNQLQPSSAGASACNSVSTVSTRDRQPSPINVQHSAEQCVGLDDSSVTLFEERMQELNRQSATARARLLELIEQQKQKTGSSVSPAVSPISPPSTSSNTVAERLMIQESSASLPERGQMSNTRANSRRPGGSVSPQSIEEGELRFINTQVDKRKEEGWFALSAHVQ